MTQTTLEPPSAALKLIVFSLLWVYKFLYGEAVVWACRRKIEFQIFSQLATASAISNTSYLTFWHFHFISFHFLALHSH